MSFSLRVYEGSLLNYRQATRLLGLLFYSLKVNTRDITAPRRDKSCMTDTAKDLDKVNFVYSS